MKMGTMTGFAVDSAVLAQLVETLGGCVTAIGDVSQRADTSGAEAAAPDTALPESLRRFAVELRSTINECRLASAKSQSGVRRSLYGYDDAEHEATARAEAMRTEFTGDRPIGAPVRIW